MVRDWVPRSLPLKLEMRRQRAEGKILRVKNGSYDDGPSTLSNLGSDGTI
jgi:hypothetical protein